MKTLAVNKRNIMCLCRVTLRRPKSKEQVEKLQSSFSSIISDTVSVSKSFSSTKPVLTTTQDNQNDRNTRDKQ